MIKKHIVIIIVCVVIVALGVLAFTVPGAQANKNLNYQEALVTLEELKRLDALLNVLVLKSRYGFEKNYDAISQLPSDIRLLQIKLAQTGEFLGEKERAEVNTHINTYIAAVEQKENVVNKFVSHNSVFRNSINYMLSEIPLLIKTAENENHERGAKLLSRLNENILEYSLLYKPTNNSEIRRLIKEISAISSVLVKSNPLLILELLIHAKTVLREKRLTDQYLTESLGIVVRGHLEKLQIVLNNHHIQQTFESSGQRWWPIGYFALLLVFMVYFGYRFQNRYSRVQGEMKKYKEDSEQSSEWIASLGSEVVSVGTNISLPLYKAANNMDSVSKHLSRVIDFFQQLKNIFAMMRAKTAGKEIGKALVELERNSRKEKWYELFENITTSQKDMVKELEKARELSDKLQEFKRTDFILLQREVRNET